MHTQSLFGIDEKIIEDFSKEYIIASNAVMISQDNNIKTKNNLIPQDLKSIIIPKKLANFLDDFLSEDVNIAYIYGLGLSGKTKSVMAYIKDLCKKNIYENIMWQDMKELNQKEQIIYMILKFAVDDKENVDKKMQEEICMKFIEKSKSVIILDFCHYKLDIQIFEFLKIIAKYTKIIIISNQPFNKYEKYLEYFSKVFSTNNFIEKQEFEQILKISSNSMLENNEELIEKLYVISGGVPFIGIYIVKTIIEEIKMGMPLKDAIEIHMNYQTNDYNQIATKIIKDIWNNLSALSKNILITCSKFQSSVSSELVAEIFDMDISNKEWREALKELYDNDLITCVILNKPRLKVNNIIKVLIMSYSKDNYDENLFIEKIAKFYIELSSYIGECYNDLGKLKLLDDTGEWDIVREVLNYLENAKRYEEYIKIVTELKYYIYVRGMWILNKDSIYLKRIEIARKINSKEEELEGLCDYINICAKSKNEEEAKKYLEIAEKIVNENLDKIDKRIVCLFYHVKALYLYNCIEDYEKAYKIWINNRKEYFGYVNEYRRLVNRLWEDRCYLKIEKNIENVYNKLIESHENAVEKNFTRGIIDYELLIASKIIEKYEQTKDYENLETAKEWLEKARNVLDKNSKDIRNEAFYYRLMAIVCSYENKKEEKENFIKKAIEFYTMMNCWQDILFLENLCK